MEIFDPELNPDIDLDNLLDRYDIIYYIEDLRELRKKDDNFKRPMTITGIVRNLKNTYYIDYNNITFELYSNFLSSCEEKKLRCNFGYKVIKENKKEKKNNIYEFLKVNENKKILIQGILDFNFYKTDDKNNDLFNICFNVKNVSCTRYNLIMSKLQKQINLKYKKDINWNNINNIAVITDLSSDDTYIFKNNIDTHYNCLFFNLIINNKDVEKNFEKTLNMISTLNVEKHFDLVILLYNDIHLYDLYNLDTFNISKMIYHFNIPFCSIISYENKHFNNEELVLSKITSFFGYLVILGKKLVEIEKGL